MNKNLENPVFRTLLILCFSLVLLVAQTNRMHMHEEHNDHSTASGHTVNIHTASSVHNVERLMQDNVHHDDSDHHLTAVDVSPDTLKLNINFLAPLVFILLFIGLILLPTRHLVSKVRNVLYIRRFTSHYYLLQPPLRAPPLI